MRRPAACARHRSAHGSSALITATPDSSSSPKRLPFSAATFSSDPMPDKWARCALVTIATVGRARRASAIISPGRFMPISTTAARCRASSRSRVSGSPISLLKLPCVASTASPKAARRMLAIISLVVVLPLLPVTAISGREKRERRQPASKPSACRVSATTISGRPGTSTFCTACPSMTAAAAPAAWAAARKSWPSKRSPRKAIKSWPWPICRLSQETPVNNRSCPSSARPSSR